ncbi:MAG: FMN-binding glutamate synthase family protein, partial [Formivibrio sp.]|nr:FMN-binding glutamate synthase family protein [Formivibrio sp.]
MKLSLLNRYSCFTFCFVFTLVSLCLFEYIEWLWPFTLMTAVLTLVGFNDLRQTQHSVRRNYPVIGNLRYLIEHIRPEIRQYLLEGDDDELPFSRTQRSLVYARAKNQSAEKAFGTLKDVYKPGFEFIVHSMLPSEVLDPKEFRIMVGGPQCRQPYSASIFNISAMSFGALSANAIRA